MVRWLAGVVISTTACVPGVAFLCQSAADCTSAGASGACELDGRCSFADRACGSGRRYGALAAERADACVADAPSCGTTRVLRDGFDAGIDPARWVAWADAGASVAGADGQLVATLPAGASAGVTSAVAYLLQDSGVSLALLDGGEPAASAALSVYGAAHRAEIVRSAGVIGFRYDQRTIDSVAADADARHVRIAERGGAAVFQTSAAGAAWRDRAAVADAGLRGLVQIEIRGVASGAPATLRVDDVNGGEPAEPWCGGGALHDDFAAPAPGDEWLAFGGDGCELRRGGRGLELVVHAGATSCGYITATRFDLRASPTTIALAEVPGDGGGLGLAVVAGDGHTYQLTARTDELGVVDLGPGGATVAGVAPGGLSEHRLARLRYDGALVAEASGDGVTWRAVARLPVAAPDVTACAITVVAFAEDDGRERSARVAAINPP